jgi:hypothetical protein
MKLPIIVNDHGDVSIYRSLEDVERALEVIDVRNGEYSAYDADGRPLLLTIMADEKPIIFGWGSSQAEGGVKAEVQHLKVFFWPRFFRSIRCRDHFRHSRIRPAA